MLNFWSKIIHSFIIEKTYIQIIYQKVNIDIGTKILKQKCFGRKTNFFNTHSNFRPAIDIYRSKAICSAYSRGCRTYILMFFRKFACGLGFAGRGDAEKTNQETNQKTRQKQPQQEEKREERREKREEREERREKREEREERREKSKN